MFFYIPSPVQTNGNSGTRLSQTRVSIIHTGKISPVVARDGEPERSFDFGDIKQNGNTTKKPKINGQQKNKSPTNCLYFMKFFFEPISEIEKFGL